MLRYVPALLSLALTVYCVIDAFQTDEADMRNLPKVAGAVCLLAVAAAVCLRSTLEARQAPAALARRSPAVRTSPTSPASSPAVRARCRRSAIA